MDTFIQLQTFTCTRKLPDEALLSLEDDVSYVK